MNHPAHDKLIAHDVADSICQAVAELPDRNSPEDWPEAMLVTHDELRQIVLDAITEWTDIAIAPGQPEVAEPIDMVLHCPKCGKQHIDAPNVLEPLVHVPSGTVVDELWSNPPHCSHLCHGCGHIWRPADVSTNGVATVKTKGKADSPIAAPTTHAAIAKEKLT